MTLLGVQYETYKNRPLKWSMQLIDRLMPKEKKKTTADELNKAKHVEVKLWQPRTNPTE